MLVTTLQRIVPADIDHVGNRALRLARLAQRGFTTALSFVLTNEAFETFISHHELQGAIGAVLQGSGGATQKYDAIRELILTREFPEGIVSEIVESYESLTGGSDAAQLVRETEAPFVMLVMSPNHHVPSESNEGIILNVRGLEQLLIAIKECWACLFTPTLQRHREAAGISARNLNMGIIIQQWVKGEVTVESWSATGGDPSMITVKSYYGQLDISSSIEKDEARLMTEHLKQIYQSTAVQSAILTRDEEDRLAKLPIGARGEGQKLTDRDVAEVARLTKKASITLEKPVKLFFTYTKEPVLLFCNELLLTSGSVKLTGYESEERIE